MRTFARWVVAVSLCGSVFGATTVAVAESGARDSGTCFGATSCSCGYVCVTGYCSYRGSAAVPAECRTDSDCRPGCYGRVCVDRRCVAPSSIDASAEAPWDAAGAPPPDRPGSEDRAADVALDRDVGTFPPVALDAGATTTDVPAATEDVPPGDQGRLVQGCGCTVPGTPPTRSWWALGLLAFGLRRRSRRAAP